ncbi:MAG: DUF2892 domain-containing protein [Desulfoprunum sp.]|nr:DUF2892 domain-containing protein [Desulfoprunum sp.]
MKINIGGIDRLLRVTVGVVLIGLAIFDRIGPWGYIGILPIATALIGWCPAYAPFGISTCCSSACCKTTCSKE